jgi:hypothetical protein
VARDDYSVSFDIFLQSFKNGDAAPGDPEAAWRALEPYLAGPPSAGYARARTSDGGAAVYGAGSDALMINHASGQVIWRSWSMSPGPPIG